MPDIVHLLLFPRTLVRDASQCFVDQGSEVFSALLAYALPVWMEKITCLVYTMQNAAHCMDYFTVVADKVMRR